MFTETTGLFVAVLVPFLLQGAVSLAATLVCPVVAYVRLRDRRKCWTARVPAAMISLASVILEEVSFRRCPGPGDLPSLAFYGVPESLGDRRLSTWWRVRGVFRVLRGERGGAT